MDSQAQDILIRIRKAEAEIEAQQHLLSSNQERLEELHQELIAYMTQAGMAEAISEDGICYRPHRASTSSYGSAAYDLIRERGIARLFEQGPKITQTAIDRLKKEGCLSEADLNDLQALKTTTVSDEIRLKRSQVKLDDRWFKQELERQKAQQSRRF